MALIGYLLGLYDDGSHMNQNMYGANICDCIDYVKNRHLHLCPNFKIKKKHFDIAITYDGYIIVSGRFRDFCLENNYAGVSFYPLGNYVDRFYMRLSNVLKYDTKRRETRFLELNASCDEYNEVVGATPVCLTNNKPLERGFYRTDIEFGRGFAKSPLGLVDIETGKKLKLEKFKGLYLGEVLTEYDFEKGKK